MRGVPDDAFRSYMEHLAAARLVQRPCKLLLLTLHDEVCPPDSAVLHPFSGFSRSVAGVLAAVVGKKTTVSLDWHEMPDVSSDIRARWQERADNAVASTDSYARALNASRPSVNDGTDLAVTAAGVFLGAWERCSPIIS